MNNKISNDAKAAVIRLYLRGESRNEIAGISEVGAGTVSNIIKGWKYSLSNPDADSLRELAINLKRVGMDPFQCAVAFRTFMIIKKIGANEDEIESFITQVISHCLQYSIPPQQIACSLRPLVDLSKSITLENIPNFIEEKENQVSALNQQIEGLQNQKKDLSMEVSALKELKNIALQDERITGSELASYSKIKEKLACYGLFLDSDFPKLAKLITNIENRGYDPEDILREYFDLQSVKAKRDEAEGEITKLEGRKSGLEISCSNLEDEQTRHYQAVVAYTQLKSIGFGFRKLKILKYTFAELAKEYNISEESAVTAVFECLEKGLEVGFGHNNNISFNPFLMPFFGTGAGRYADQKQNNEQGLNQEQAQCNPVSKSKSKALAFPSVWYLFQGQHRLQLPLPSSSSTKTTTRQPPRSPTATCLADVSHNNSDYTNVDKSLNNYNLDGSILDY